MVSINKQKVRGEYDMQQLTPDTLNTTGADDLRTEHRKCLFRKHSRVDINLPKRVQVHFLLLISITERK